MLTLFRRHKKGCKFRHLGRKYRNCQCPISVEGMVHGQMVRKSLDLRSWEAAQKAAQDFEINGLREIVTLKIAVDRFIAARRAKGNSEETIKKLNQLTGKVQAYFGDIPIEKMTDDDVARFYESWTVAPITKGKQLERMRSFFNFCVRRKWMEENPCVGIERPAILEIERKPFEPAELEKITWAIPLFPKKGIYGEGNKERLTALIAVLRWTGLRIRDIVQLRRSQIQGEYIVLRTHKNKRAVKLLMHREIQDALASLNSTGEYFFWSGLGNPKSCVGDWQRTLRRLSKISGVHVHAHRFRHTFAADLLSNGVSVANVAAILGNSVRIVEKHYAQFVEQRQKSLDKDVISVWNQAALK